jgi:hypothetical protein
MTAETLTNVLPFAGMLALLALFGVLALVDAWREWRQKRAVRRRVKSVTVAREYGLLTHNQAIELLRREGRR